MAHVFISYARENQDFAEVVQAKLQRGGHTTSLDLDIVRAGDDWGTRLELAIRSANALAVVMTPEAQSSEYVTYEWAFALGAGIRVLALDLTPTAHHPRLNVLQRLDFTGKVRPWELFLAEVAKTEGVRALDPSTFGGLPAVVKLAIRALDSLDSKERAEAIATLAKAKGDGARQALAQALEHPLSDVRMAAARVYPDRKDVRIIQGLFDSAAEKQIRIADLRKELCAIGAAAVPELLALWSERIEAPGFVREGIVAALGDLGDSRATQLLFTALRDPKGHMRAAAAQGLGNIGGEGAVAALRTALTDPELTVRLEAVAGLGKLGGESAIAALRTALMDPDLDVRTRATEKLGQRREPSSTSALVEVLTSDVRVLRVLAAQALGIAGDRAAVPALTKALEDSEEQVRLAAAQALCLLGDPLPLQEQLTKHGRIGFTDGRALSVLVRSGDEAAFPLVERLLVQTTLGSIDEVVQALVDHGPSGMRLLDRVLAASPTDGDVLLAIPRALAQSNTPEAREVLRKWRLRN